MKVEGGELTHRYSVYTRRHSPWAFEWAYRTVKEARKQAEVLSTSGRGRVLITERVPIGVVENGKFKRLGGKGK